MKSDYVYIVEDDSITSYVIKVELQNHGSFDKSEVYNNGQIAYEQLSSSIQNNKRVPDLILLDINMPIMDGWEFLNAFSQLENTDDISVVMLTSSINPVDLEKAKSYKAVKGFFSKPLTSDKLDEIKQIN